MTSNLKFRAIAIVVVILVCVYGIIGLPKSKEELADNWRKNIRLGLDLKGGSHLVLQVQLQDAFKSEADSVINRMKDEGDVASPAGMAVEDAAALAGKPMKNVTPKKKK